MAVFVVFASISTVTGIILYLFIKETLNRSHTEAVLAEGQAILENTNYNPTEIPITDEDQWIYVWFESEGNPFEVYQKNDFPSPELILNDISSLENDTLQITASTTFTKDTIIYALVTKEVQGTADGKLNLILAKSNTNFMNQLRTVRSNLFMANAIAVVFSLLLAYALAGYSLRPVKSIIEKANLIKAGPSMERLPVGNSGDEIARLSATMNAMINRIENSIKDQNRFFASAAHELRTPLANMQSELEYRMSIHKTPDSSLESLRDEVIRLKSVVQDFLLVSQLKNETLELRKQKINTEDLIYDVLENLRPALKKASIEIKLELESDLQSISMDVHKMQSLLVNLIDNSIKHGDNSKGIFMKLAKAKEGVVLEIFNLIPVSISNSTGSGLGLWVCERIAQLHDFGFDIQQKRNEFRVFLHLSN